MDFSFLENLLVNFKKFPFRNAFHILGKDYTYRDLEMLTAAIQENTERVSPGKGQPFGIYTFNDLPTYAGILALWFSGKTFIPLNPRNPASRNENIIRQTGIKFILHSDEIPASSFAKGGWIKTIKTNIIPDPGKEISFISPSPEDIFYILFTSGSTGEPKGVPITRGNLNSFVGSFINYGYDFSEEDRFLQIYDLSFDASVHCYTVPLAVGGCVYTVPQDQIKYLYAYKLMQEKQLTFVKMPPSTLAYLKPYFSSVHLPGLKYCLLGGEAFPEILAKAWAPCVPNAVIQNVYGPTEATINCLIYSWKPSSSELKSDGGIVSVGKTFGDNTAIIVGEDSEILPNGQKGELCIAGEQVTPGYWNDPEKSSRSFFEKEYQGRKYRFYRTGDLAFFDKEGDVMFCGRIDTQVQIQGYRVELGEIEKHARDYLSAANIAVVSRENEQGTVEIYLFTEGAEGEEDKLMTYLQERLPSYMLPQRIINLEELPKSVGGKINKTELLNLI